MYNFHWCQFYLVSLLYFEINIDPFNCIKTGRGGGDLLVLYFSAAASATTPIFRLHPNQGVKLTKIP